MRRAAAILLTWAALLPASAPAEPIVLLEPLTDGSRVELPPLASDVASPAEFLGYSLGHRFTHHEKIVEYLEHLAAASERVEIRPYGETYEGRPLVLAAISSPENLARLAEIQAEQQRLARGEIDPADLERSAEPMPIVVWLAYGVHGNESSSAEAAMAAAWVFASAQGEWSKLLEDAVVLIDPLCNPDGRERYVHSFETRRGREPDPLGASAEHREPWPGGRQNHYLVDLNRDWAWITQKETRDRLRAYRTWEPQVYVDFHEMSAESSYFFPPTADPVHPHIRPRSLYWLETFGRANAGAFDRRGWVYYVGERFDLFYPGYGDSYPSLRGAIGMTYEMAGHGRAGQALERSDGSLLTLADRVARHLTTSIATVRTAIEHRTGLLSDFARGRIENNEAAPSTYLWRPDAREAAAAADLLEEHGIEVAVLAQEATLRARPLLGGEAEKRTFPAGTYAVSTAQPLGGLARALLDLDASMPDAFLAEQRRRLEQNRSTQFYDITAWSVPLAYNLETWIAAGRPDQLTSRPEPATRVTGSGDLGFLIEPQGLAGYRFAARLQAEGIGFRLALDAFEIGAEAFASGTLFVPRAGNPEDLDESLAGLAAASGVSAHRVASGYARRGASLGSDSAVPVRGSRIGLVGGEGVRPTSFGFLWHLLDQEIQATHHRLEVSSLAKIDLAKFDVLVLPSGSYGSVSAATAEKIEAWLRAGGVLVAVGAAGDWLRERELSALETWQPPKASEEANTVTALTPANRELHTPGAALATRIAQPHPLTAGLERDPAVLYDDRRVLLATGNPRRDIVVVAEDEAIAAGFAWPEAEERLRGSLLLGLEPKGRGAIVVFAQEPVFRLFWRGTAPLFLNAVLYGPSLAEHGHLR